MHSETKHEFVKNLMIDEIKKNTNYARIRPLKDTPIYLSLLDNEEDLILQPGKLIHSYLDKNMFKKIKTMMCIIFIKIVTFLTLS